MWVWSAKIVHPPVIDREIFDRVQVMLSGRRTWLRLRWTLIYASSMVMLDSARRRMLVHALRRSLLGAGIAATLATNLTDPADRPGCPACRTLPLTEW
jgi:hypothetical protein